MSGSNHPGSRRGTKSPGLPPEGGRSLEPQAGSSSMLPPGARSGSIATDAGHQARGASEISDPELLLEAEVLDPALLTEIVDDPNASSSQSAPIARGASAPDLLDLATLPSVQDSRVSGLEMVEGFENTRLDNAFDRPSKKRTEEVPGAVPRMFTYSTCPGCNLAQPEPPPAFCESCGTRLRMPARKGTAETNAKRCRECGFRSPNDSSTCTNCGNRLR